MAEVKREGDTILIGDRVLIEQGPQLLTAVATEELLSDAQTAAHYKVGMRDAKGKKIALGEPMSYLDYGSALDGGAPGKSVFYVFEKVDIPEEDRSKEGEETTDESRWIERGTRATEDSAISLGQEIAGA